MGLHERWPLPAATDTRDALLAAYADPARGYHDLRHLTEVLDRLDELPPAYDRVPVVLAAWFHDAVHDGAAGEEERSARWALAALAGRPEAEEVARLVRLTEHHRPADDDANGCALSDADLAILAAAPERYAEYVATVRSEYSHVPDDDFRTGRTAVLTDLLAKPRLFHTAYALEHWEEAARLNVSREVEEMAPPSGRNGPSS